MSLTVLVTGAGALLGQGILRSLRMTKRPLRIVTADPDMRSAGHWLGDHVHAIKMANDPAYLADLERILGTEHFDAVFVGTDTELPPISSARGDLERQFGTNIIISDPRVIQIANDKFLTAEFLRSSNLPFARSARADDASGVAALIEEVGFPLFAKPRVGARSVGVEILHDAYDVDRICARHPDYVLQELLDDREGEYTAGTLTFGGRCSTVVNLRRDLRDGNTWRAYREADTDRFDQQLREISEKLDAYGPANFQFRVRYGLPIVFEINARFSGTTPMRAIFGFNEVEATLDHVLTGIDVSEPKLRQGTVMKTMSDLFVPPGGLDIPGRIGKVKPAGEFFEFDPKEAKPLL